MHVDELKILRATDKSKGGDDRARAQSTLWKEADADISILKRATPPFTKSCFEIAAVAGQWPGG
jgi:hypothetical protein